jgi:hypothetical protein
MSDENLDLTQHGYQDAKITVNAPRDDTVVMSNLSLTDTNAATLQFIDGTYTNGSAATGSFALDPNAAAVARIYHATLNRDPDFNGEAYWKQQLYSGQQTQQQMADQFVGSPEFVSTYGNLSNANFVTQLYQNVLGRAPDPSGGTYWTNVLNGGTMDRGGVVLSFSNSTEFMTNLATKNLVGPGGIQFAGNVDHAPNV